MPAICCTETIFRRHYKTTTELNACFTGNLLRSTPTGTAKSKQTTVLKLNEITTTSLITRPLSHQAVSQPPTPQPRRAGRQPTSRRPHPSPQHPAWCSSTNEKTSQHRHHQPYSALHTKFTNKTTINNKKKDEISTNTCCLQNEEALRKRTITCSITETTRRNKTLL